MKANELRLGNWLLNPVQKCAVPMDSRMFYDIIARERAAIDIGWEPIELNEEWLISFRFKHFGENEFLSLEAFSPGHPSQRFDIDWSERTGLMCKSRYQQDSDWFFMRHVQYVHQLQNLYFALTGEEITIKK